MYMLLKFRKCVHVHASQWRCCVLKTKWAVFSDPNTYMYVLYTCVYQIVCMCGGGLSTKTSKLILRTNAQHMFYLFICNIICCQCSHTLGIYSKSSFAFDPITNALIY